MKQKIIYLVRRNVWNASNSIPQKCVTRQLIENIWGLFRWLTSVTSNQHNFNLLSRNLVLLSRTKTTYGNSRFDRKGRGIVNRSLCCTRRQGQLSWKWKWAVKDHAFIILGHPVPRPFWIFAVLTRCLWKSFKRYIFETKKKRKEEKVEK